MHIANAIVNLDPRGVVFVGNHKMFRHFDENAPAILVPTPDACHSLATCIRVIVSGRKLRLETVTDTEISISTDGELLVGKCLRDALAARANNSKLLSDIFNEDTVIANTYKLPAGYFAEREIGRVPLEQEGDKNDAGFAHVGLILDKALGIARLVIGDRDEDIFGIATTNNQAILLGAVGMRTDGTFKFAPLDEYCKKYRGDVQMREVASGELDDIMKVLEKVFAH